MKKFQDMKSLRPIKRSKIRIYIGKKYYIFRRYIQWITNYKKYARSMDNNLYDNIAFSHQTPLLRELKNVDMWMQHNKIININIAMKKLNNIVIYPGQTFSYWRLIGKTSKRKGYVKGMILYYGKFKEGIGGGLCQLSNLIYWMTQHTELTVTERYRHSYDVFPDSNRTQPFGSGATCVYNYRDLKIYNGTNHPYQLHLQISNGHLIGQWRTQERVEYSYKVYQKEHIITHEFWGAYVRHNLIHRKKYDLKGKLISDEYVTENHALMMYQPFLEEIGQKVVGL